MLERAKSNMSLTPQYFQKLVESCPDIIIAVDRQGIITFYNDGARQNLGFSPEEVLGKDVLEVYPDIDEARRVMGEMRADQGEGKGRVRNFETIFKTKKGERIPVAISASIIYDDDGQESGSIGFAKDIRELRRRDQLATLCEFAIGLSHEINNSLEVDDDAGICQSLKDLLEEERCNIETATSGVVAMERLNRQEFDVVLSDVVMPEQLLLQQCRPEQATPQPSIAPQPAIATTENPKTN